MLVACVLFCAVGALGFNVDIPSRVVYRGYNNSMFGFTVQAHVDGNQKMILVGAPEADSSYLTSLRRPGVVFRCAPGQRGYESGTPLDMCREMRFDQKPGNNEDKARHPIDQKSNQWFGATLSSTGRNGPIVIISPPTQTTYPGCRTIVSEAYIRRGTPTSALPVMLNSLSPNSIKQYDSALKAWWNFSQQHKVNIYEASVPVIISFLNDRFNKGASYGTLNTIKSALALLLGPRINNDDRIKRYMKGAFRSKPPKPRYNLTWDPGLVLNHLVSYGENGLIKFENLTKKLVTIIALTSGHRVQTLSLIKLNNIKFVTDGVQIKIPDTIKTTKQGALQPLLYLKYYEKNINICPVHTLKAYMEATKTRRGTVENLIITIKKPYQKASPQSISRWIKRTLEDAGIDVEVFSAHSTRHASTSAAHKSGISIDLIRKTAGWSQNSAVFAKFYQRPIVEDPTSFSQAVCDTAMISNN